MKKYLLIMIASLIFGGSVFAQTTHWTCDDSQCPNTMPVAFWVTLDGNYLGNTQIPDNHYDIDIEVAAFIVNEENEECRMTTFLYNLASELPHLYVFKGVQYKDGELEATVKFKMFIHSTGKEYDMCDFSATISENGYVNPEAPVVLPFHTYFTKTITPYTVVGTNEEDKANHWYLIASPIGTVNPEDVTNMLTNNYDLYYYDQTQEKEWKNYKANQFDLVPGKGYLYANSGDNGNAVTLTFVGTPYNNPGEVSLVYDAGVNQNTDLIGWNLVGNPFPETAYIDRNFYRMNADGTDLITASGAIESMEGVFVKSTGTADNSLTFSTSPTKGGEQLVVSLSQNRGASIDRAIVCFNEGDVLPKFMLNENNTKLYVPQDDHDYAVVRSAAQGEFPLNFRASENGTYTLNIDTENVEMNYLHLIDNLTGMDVDLLQTPSYSFEAKVNDYESRFRLVFAANNEDVVSTGSTAFAFFSNGNWIINNDGKATLQIMDINGRVLCNEQVNGCYSKSFEAAPGVYMLRLINGDNVKVQKLVVR